MAVRGYAVKMLVDEFDLSGQSNRVSIDASVAPLEAPVFQNPAVEITPGQASAAIEHGGYFIGANAGQLERVFYDRLGSSVAAYVGVLLGTDQPIVVGYVQDATWAQQLKIDTPVKEVITLSGNWPFTGGGLKRGYLLYDGAISATGAKPGIDFGAAGAAGGVAYLFVPSITGTATSATVTVQSDSDSGFGTAATEGTFTFSAVGVVKIALSGVIGRYLRINTTSLGGATAFSVAAVAGVSGVTM
jgi:hypothetical protein